MNLHDDHFPAKLIATEQVALQLNRSETHSVFNMRKLANLTHGPMYFNKHTGRFMYRPSNGDVFDIPVAFEVNQRGTVHSRKTTTLVPRPSAVSEYEKAIPSGRQLPDETSSRYWTAQILASEKRKFNWLEVEPKTIVFTGKKLVFDSKMERGPYSFVKSNMTDVEHLIISGETVVIKELIVARGASLTIRARNLIFEGSGRLQNVTFAFRAPK